MAIISKREIAGMDKEALKKKLAEIESEIAQNMGAIRSAAKPTNNKFRELKKLRATIKLSLSKKGEKV
jgi:ribosomal protein L29